MEIIKKYFPELPRDQVDRLEALWPAYREWNKKINVISRRDMEHFFERHVLHSLSVMKVVRFMDGTKILDAGTGGGFPGIPLAICFPACRFTLVDSIGKKIGVVKEIADTMGLDNVEAIHARVEDIKGRFDFVTSRAVKPLPVFVPWVAGKIKPGGKHELPNGILYLKGGDFGDEIEGLGLKHQIFPLSAYFEEEFFETKKLLSLWSDKIKS